MSTLTPSARAAFVYFLLLTVGGIAATGLILADGWTAAEEAAQRELAATAAALAADPQLATAPPGVLDTRLGRLAGRHDLAGLAVLADGRVRAASDRARLGEMNWTAALDQEPASGPWLVGWGSGEYYLAVSAPAVTPYGETVRVAVLRDAGDVRTAFKPFSRGVVVIAVVVWLLGAVGLYGMAWYGGARVANRTQALAERIGALEPEHIGRADDLIESERDTLGGLVGPFEAMAYALGQAYGRAAEARSHMAALLQINPHYVLVCTLDGHIVDANPAFYAITGLPFEAVRGGRVEVLAEVMPVEPLFELARRSFREGSSLSGIEYAIINRDDVRRPVQVSLRAVLVDGREGVVIQATDVANQRNLERQISTFSDALDLMVDQRVAQLTAGNNSVARLLDDAGIVLASFDPGGGTRRWNQAAEALTGRRAGQVPHFSAFTGVLGLDPVTQQAFSDWFWSENAGSFSVRLAAAGGPPRRMLWRKGMTGEDGRAERRVLLGIDLPRAERPSGDSAGGAVPGLDAVTPAADGSDSIGSGAIPAREDTTEAPLWNADVP